MSDDDGFVESCIAGACQAHRRLAETIEHLDDRVARGPSRLPDWTVGHVLTHIARNGDSHVRMLHGVLSGEHLEQYAGGMEQRASDIEAGASRPAATLVEDISRSSAALEETWTAMTPEAWDDHGMGGGKPWPCRLMPLQRWREVEVHHVDLGLGYEVEQWPEDYVSTELGNLSTNDSARRLLAWIMGRGDAPDAADLRPWTSRP